MTTKRRERSIKELYGVTEMITKPEITPVLEGSCRIQGPVDELDDGLQQTNCVTLPAEKGYMIVNKTTRTRVESGTCNVCSAPCSSCMHINRTTSVMESNVEGAYSVNKLRSEEVDCCSYDGSGNLPPYKSRACDNPQHATSETSNLLSVSSSHDSYSENAESKSTLIATNDVSEDVEMHPKLSVEAVGECGLLPKETNISSSCLLSSKSNLISVPHLEPFRSGKEEQRDLECHGDNISCATGGLDAAIAVSVCNADVDVKELVIGVASTESEIAGIERKTQLEAGNLCLDDEIRECKVKVEELNACQNDLLQKKDSRSSVKDECSKKPDCVDHSSLKLNSAKVEPSEYFTVNMELSTRVVEASANVEGEKTILPDHEDRKTSQLKSAFSSGTQKSGYSCLETRNQGENDVTDDKDCEAVKCSTMKELSRMSSTLLEGYKIQALEKQSQPTCVGENSDSDIEDDVKVCDICGDAGREECLAVCSKCSDGAEHTYCMRIMLEKIPEGDWLCEECKLKEDTENDEVDRIEVIQEKLAVPSLKESVVSSETIPSPKVSLKLDSEVNEQEAKGVVKRTHSQHVSAHRLPDNAEVSSIAGKRSSESNGSFIETSSPRKKVALSCDSSLKKLDLTKVKPANITPSVGSHSGHSSPQAFVRAQMSGSYPSKVQSQAQTPRGSLSRSMSLNNSGMKGKVKQLIENIPHKPKVTKDYASKDTRKDRGVRTATKSASFRSIGSSRLNVESTIKTQFVSSPRSEDSKSFKHPKDRNPFEKKNSFKLEQTPVTPSTISNTIPLKAELKGAQVSGKSNNASESNVVGVTKRLGDANDLGHCEVKKQPLNASKALGSSSLNSLGQKSYGMRNIKSSIQSETLPQHEDKSKDSNLFSSSRQVGQSSGRVLRCQKCNETGHSTQFCSIDKLRVSALKPSAERNLKETTVKSDRWKNAVEALFSKTKMQKDGRSLDNADSSTVTARSSREVGPKDVPTSSSSSFQGGLISRQEVFRTSATSPGLTGASIGVKQPDNHQMETCIPVDRHPKAMPTSLEESTGVPSVPTTTDPCSDQGCPMRVSVFPELEFIWQGDFEVLRTGRLLEPCNGVQAHLSTCASPKVLEVVNKFPGKVKLEEVPRSCTWPLQFQRISPKEDNIALFLFARDIESYEKNYKKLLENMLENDLALKGFIDEVELLIFPSDKLPENSQRWNNLFFLWAVFRERRINCSDALPGPQRSCKSSLQEEPLVRDSSLLVASDFSTSKNINLHEFPMKDSSKFEMLPKAGIVEHNTQLSSETAGELQCEISPCPDLGHQITTSHLCLEQNSGVASPEISAPVQDDRCAEPRKNKIFGNDTMDGMDAETSNNVPNSLNKHGALPILPVTCVSTACRDGGEYSANPEKLQETTVLGNDPRDCMTAVDNLESKPSRKRACSCSVDANLQASGETLKVVDGTITGKENMNYRAEHNEKDHKKAKLGNDDGYADIPEAPHHRETMDEMTDKPEISKSVERYIFPFDLNSMSCEETETETEMERVIHVLSSDDEEIQEPVFPDLELALGGKKKFVKHERQPLIFPIVSSKINQHPKPAARQDDYASASLSLSLAIPKSENEQTASNDVQKTSIWQL